MCLPTSNDDKSSTKQCLPSEEGNTTMKTRISTSTTSAKTTQNLCGKPECLSTESYALLLLVLSAVFYSVMGAYIKLATATGLSSTELVFLRAVFQGALVVLAMLWFRDGDNVDENHPNGPRLIWVPFGTPPVRNVVLTRGIIGGLGFLLYYYTISVLPLGDATTLLSLNPIVTVLAASIFLKEPLRVTHVVAALVCLVGCALIAKPSFLFGRAENTSVFDKNLHASSGYIAALISTSCGATVYILIRRAGKVGVHTLQLLFSWVAFGTFFSLLVGVIIPFARGQENPFVWPSDFQSMMDVLICCLFGSLGHLLMNFAAQHAPAGLASIMRASGIMWSYGLEVLVFGQVPHILTICGAVLIVISLSTIALEKQRESFTYQKKTATKSLMEFSTAESTSLIGQAQGIDINNALPSEPSSGISPPNYGSGNVV